MASSEKATASDVAFIIFIIILVICILAMIIATIGSSHGWFDKKPLSRIATADSHRSLHGPTSVYLSAGSIISALVLVIIYFSRKKTESFTEKLFRP